MGGGGVQGKWTWKKNPSLGIKNAQNILTNHMEWKKLCFTSKKIPPPHHFSHGQAPRSVTMSQDEQDKNKVNQHLEDL